MKKKNTISIALVGTGRISAAHFESLKSLPAYSLKYVSDTNTSRGHSAAATNGATYIADYKKIPLEHIDVVAITTPNYLHYEMAKYFLERGVHVILEKPMTISPKDSDKLIAVAKKHKTHLFPVLQVRYNPAVRVVKEAIQKGAFGKLLSANLTMHWNRPQAYFDGDVWRGKKKLDGGTFINQGIHYLDLLMWMCGRVESVYSVAETLNHKIQVEDHLSAIMRFKNGTIGTIDFSVNTYPKNRECSITLLGRDGTVKIGGQATNEIEHWEVKDTPKPDVAAGIAPNVYAKGLYQGSCPNHVYVYEDVQRVLSGSSKKPGTSAIDARDSLAVIEAMYRSAETGKEVTIK